jgi:hypothetical protein
MKTKIAIIEQGEYSDYCMYFVRIPPKKEISDKNLLFLLGLDEWSQPELSGYILGDVIEHEVRDLKSEVEKEINQMFSCYDNRKYTTILDKKHTKKELLNIAISNDNSGVEYWGKEIESRYPKYLKAFRLYQQLKNN